MSLIEKIRKNKIVKEYLKVEEDDGHVEYISTGVASLNILFSGKIDGGIIKNKINQMAAP